MVFKRLALWIGEVFRRLFDKVSTRYYEGPTPPLRLIQAVEAFAMLNPHATQGEWVRFAALHAGEAYKSGYIRGLEWRQRAPEKMDPSTSWALIESDEREHGWSWVDMAPGPEQLKQIVEENPDMMERLAPEERALYQDMIGRQFGTHQVIIVPGTDPKQR